MAMATNLEKGYNEGDWNTYNKTHNDLIAFASNMAIYWKQRAKIKWNIEGDTCSRYFFYWAKGRSSRNLISSIRLASNELIHDIHTIQMLFRQYYIDLF